MSQPSASKLSLIITANFLHKSDKVHRWLTREPEAHPKRSIPRTQIRAEDVVFSASTVEQNFDCSTVATSVSSKVEFDFPPPDRAQLSQLHFCDGQFVVHGTYVTVDRARVLYMLPDGTMWAELEEDKRREVQVILSR